MIKDYDLIGYWLVLNIGNDRKIQIKKDPYQVCSIAYSLPEDMINHLKEIGYLFLYQIQAHIHSSLVSRKWLHVVVLGF